MVDSFDGQQLRLKLPPELKDLANPGLEQEIRQALDLHLNVSCQLSIISQATLDSETPYQARIREQEAHRCAAIVEIKQSEMVKKLNRAFGAELIESSVRKIGE